MSVAIYKISDRPAWPARLTAWDPWWILGMIVALEAGFRSVILFGNDIRGAGEKAFFLSMAALAASAALKGRQIALRSSPDSRSRFDVFDLPARCAAALLGVLGATIDARSRDAIIAPPLMLWASVAFATWTAFYHVGRTRGGWRAWAADVIR